MAVSPKPSCSFAPRLANASSPLLDTNLLENIWITD
jgi:hypothetical protein